MLFVRLALIVATVVLVVVVAKLVLTLALVAAIIVVAVLALRYVRTFGSELVARRRAVTPLPQRRIRVVRS